MEFGILGPLEATRDGSSVPIPGAKQRALLAVLLVHAGEVLSGERLADILWGDEQPANPRNALQSQISQLRRLLGPDGKSTVASRPTGYVLAAAPEAIDAARFEALVGRGRAALRSGDAVTASTNLRDGLALWRGPALEEFAGQPFADATISHLEELRLGANEDRIEADLAVGRHTDLVPELEALVRAHPLRERLRGLLMLALYRSGRQADALEVYHDTRSTLEQELGLDPSPELTHRYEQLLRHEVEPSPTPGTPLPPDDPADLERPSSDPSSGRHGDAEHRPTTLPVPLSSFVGRDDELGRVIDLVRAGRLITLTGPGGVGKTRLATEAANALRDDPVTEDGAWFVELAAVTDPDLLVAEVAATLGISDESANVPGALGSGADPVGRVAASLRRRRALLVLDNCEHLVEAAAAFAHGLVTAAPNLTVLCTTREALGITGETVWSVPSLPVPPEDHHPDGPDDLLGWGAVQLFVDRARERDPGFTYDSISAPLVADICRRLDGIPLALELAAARMRALGPQVLAARLDDRFQLLTSGDRTSQPRQATLRAVVEWSWDLLDGRERALFRRLAVFAGATDLTAIEAVCADRDLPVTTIVDVLTDLVDKSVVLVEHAAGDRRYRMLETLRAYGLEQLEAAEEGQEVRDRYARYVTTYVVARVPALRGPEQITAMHDIDRMLPDLRSAMRWFEDSEDIASGARVAVELGWYWYLKGTRKEAIRWLSSFAGSTDPRDAALAELWSAFLATGFGPLDELRHRLSHAIRVLLEHGDDRDIALSQLVAADVAGVIGDADALDVHLRNARDAAQRAGDEGYLATADFVVGHAHVSAGRFEEATPWLETALERFRAIGDRWGQVQCLMAILGTTELIGDVDTSRVQAERALVLAEELRLHEMEGLIHARLAMLCSLAGDDTSASTSLRRARRTAHQLGSDLIVANADLAGGIMALRRGDLDTAEQDMLSLLDWIPQPDSYVRAETFARLGLVAEQRGDLDAALAHHATACQAALALGQPRTVAFAFEAAASTLAAAGRAEEAALLLGAADARRRATGPPLPEVERADVERAERRCRELLGDTVFDAMLVEGSSTDDAELPVPGVAEWQTG